ncbi:MAG: hypothetical protein ACLFRV_03950 [Acidimicrobiales bacterium]
MSAIREQTADASTAVDLYTVGAGKWATVQVLVNNRGSSTRTITVSVRANGDAQADAHEVCTDLDVDPGSHALDQSLTMKASDVLTVEASSSDVTIQAFGIESDIP